MIQNRTKAWKQGLKRPEEPAKTHYSAKIIRREFRASGGERQAAGLKPLAAARPSDPVGAQRRRCGDVGGRAAAESAAARHNPFFSPRNAYQHRR